MGRLLGKFLGWLFDFLSKKCGLTLEIEHETTKTKIKFHKD